MSFSSAHKKHYFNRFKCTFTSLIIDKIAEKNERLCLCKFGASAASTVRVGMFWATRFKQGCLNRAYMEVLAAWSNKTFPPAAKCERV